MDFPPYRALLIIGVGLFFLGLSTVVLAQPSFEEGIIALKTQHYGDPTHIEPIFLTDDDKIEMPGPNDLNPYDVVVFQSGRSGNWDIYKLTGSDPNPVPIVASPLHELRPRFLPNGNEIVFTRVYSDTQYDIYRFNITTGVEIQLTQGNINTHPVWSWDGTQIYFTSNRTGNYEIFRMDNSGGNVVQITNNGAPDLSPTISPDGTQIAWIRVVNQTQGQLMIANSDGTSEIAVTMPYAFIQNPTWAPNGVEILFDADISGDNWNDLAKYLITQSQTTGFQSAERRHDLWASGWDQRVPNVIYFTDVRYAESDLQIVEAQLFRKLSTAYTSAFLTGAIDLHPSVGSSDNTIPTTRLNPLPTLSRQQGVALRWTSQDAGPASAASYEVQASRFPTNPEWITVGTSPIPFFVYRDSVVGDDIQFRVRSIDAANNVGPWSTVYSTKIYTNLLDVTVTDARGYPYPYDSITFDLTPSAIFREAQDRTTIRLYQSSLHTTNIHTLVPQTDALDSATLDSYYPSAYTTYTHENPTYIVNGGFENDFVEWESEGTVYQVENGEHSGTGSAYFGSNCIGCWAEAEPLNGVGSWKDTAFFDSLIDPQGTLHLVYVDRTGKIYYRQRPRAGTWTNSLLNSADYVPIVSTAPRIELARDSNGQLHTVFPKNGSIVHMMRQTNGTWTTPNPILNDYAENIEGNTLATDAFGGVYFVGHQYDQQAAPEERYKIVFRKRNTNGSWSTPEIMHQSPVDIKSQSELAVLSSGIVHLLYSDLEASPPPTYPVYYPHHKVRLTNGTWIELDRPFAKSPRELERIHPKQILVDSNDTIHAIFQIYREDDPYPPNNVFYSQWRNSQEGWTTPETLLIIDPAYGVSATSLFLGPNNQVYVYLHSAYYTTGDTILQRTEDGTWMQTSVIPYFKQFFQFIHPYYDPIEGFVFIAQVYDNTTYALEFWKWQTATTDESHSLSQHITIPGSTSLPTLAFFYKFQRTLPDATTALEVKINDGFTTTVIYSDTASVTGWQHGWADLSPWISENITITFQLNQVAGEPLPLLRIDDVTLSPYLRPILDNVSPSHIEQGWDGQVITVTGSNLVPPLTVTANGTDVTVTPINTSTIEITLTDDIEAGDVVLEVRNGNYRTATIESLGLGYRTFAPLLQR